MISWIGLERRLGPNGQAVEEEEADTSQGATLMFAVRPLRLRGGNIWPREPLRPQLVLIGAPPLGETAASSRHRGREEVEEKRRRQGGKRRGSCGWHSPRCFAWQRGFVCSPEPLFYSRVLASAQRPRAVGPPREVSTKKRKKGRGKKEESVVSLQRNPGAVCLPRRCCCCRARSEISCSALERRHLFPSAVLHCRFKG